MGWDGMNSAAVAQAGSCPPFFSLPKSLEESFIADIGLGAPIGDQTTVLLPSFRLSDHTHANARTNWCYCML